MQRVSARGTPAGLIVALLATATAATAGGLVPNPANDKRLVDKPIEDFRYDYAKRCADDPQKGTLALQRWLDRNVRGFPIGINRCERLGSGFSIHSEGRALDWHLDARNSKEKKAAMRLIRTLLARDQNGQPAALARRMGVQGLIFDCKSWWSGQQDLGKYSYCYKADGEKKNNLDPTQAHVDHVHIELNWAGARKRTSFWNSPLARQAGEFAGRRPE